MDGISVLKAGKNPLRTLMSARFERSLGKTQAPGMESNLISLLNKARPFNLALLFGWNRNKSAPD
jgi:hypothetical protein